MFSFFGFSSAHFSYKQTSFKVYLLLFTTQSACRALSVYSNCNQTFPSAWLTVWTNRTRKTFSYMSIWQNTKPPIIYYLISKSSWIACHWQCWCWFLYLWSWRHLSTFHVGSCNGFFFCSVVLSVFYAADFRPNWNLLQTRSEEFGSNWICLLPSGLFVPQIMTICCASSVMNISYVSDTEKQVESWGKKWHYVARWKIRWKVDGCVIYWVYVPLTIH